ncbi:MAG: hypothetical protein K2X55_14230, partial [Burkholderiaceae bacterium]|nr:hypothetical protein [Burkholderiaceae bacterium]
TRDSLREGFYKWQSVALWKELVVAARHTVQNVTCHLDSVATCLQISKCQFLSSLMIAVCKLF